MSHRCRMLTGPNPRAPATDIESRKPTVLYCCVPRGTSWIYRIYLSDLTAVKLNGSHPDGTNQEYARAYVKVPRPVEYSHPSPVGSPPPRPPPLHIYIPLFSGTSPTSTVAEIPIIPFLAESVTQQLRKRSIYRSFRLG